MTQRRLSLLAFDIGCVSTLFVAVVVVGRIARDGVQMYGCDGAPYIEHVARLQTLKAWREGSLFSPWDMFVSMDGAFPPLMHLVTLPLGVLAGHQAWVALFSGLFWLLLLAGSVGVLASALSGERLAGLAAFVGVLFLPAVHGFATRYYYDLPMTALIWASAAAMVTWVEDRPIKAAVLSGLGFSAACLVKWSALPFGLPVLVGAALCKREDSLRSSFRSYLFRRVRIAGAALILVAVICGLFLWSSGPDNSYATMQAETFEWTEPTAPLSPFVAALLPGPLGFVTQEAVAGLQHWDGEALRFYALRAVTSVYSPILSALLALLCLVWLFRDRRGAPLLVVALAGNALFLLLVLRLLDDRFLLVIAPLPVVLAAMAWLELPRVLRWLAAALVLVVGPAVALDFHFGNPASWNQGQELWVADQGRPPVILRGLGLASSVKQLGWARADEQSHSQRSYREALWRTVSRCRYGRVGELDDRQVLGGCGNRFWWDYRGDLEEIRHDGPGRLTFIGGSVWSLQDSGYGDRGSNGPDLLLVGPDPAGVAKGLPVGLAAEDWVSLGGVSDPEGPANAQLWARYDVDPCDNTAPP